MPERLPSRAVAFLLAGLYLLAWLVPLADRPLFEPDEGRYAEIPREMVVSGDWITPRLNGYRYFEKPPLQYWGTAAAYLVLGPTPFASRLWSILAGIGAILAVGYGARRLFGAVAGAYSAIVLAGSLLFAGMGLFNTLDMGVSAFLGAAVIAVCLAQERRDDPAALRRFMLLTWAAMALAVLSKGLIGIVLPGGTLVLYSLWQRDGGIWRRLDLAAGLPLFLLVTAPWFVLVSLANHDFPRFFFLNEHFSRFLSDSHQREQPFFFFPAILPAALLPFTVPALVGLWRGLREPAARGRFDARRLMTAFVVFTVVFFSLSRSKLIGYLGPTLPPLAVLAGVALSRAPAPRLRSAAWITGAFAALLLVGSAFLSLVSDERVTPEGLAAFRPFMLGAGGLMLAGAVLGHRVAARGAGLLAASLVALAWIAGASTMMRGAATLFPERSSERLAELLRPHLGPRTKLYSVDRYDQSLPFYLGRKFTLVRYRGELQFGIESEPGGWVPHYDAFVPIWREEKDAVGITAPEEYEHLRSIGVPMEKLFETPKRVGFRRP